MIEGLEAATMLILDNLRDPSPLNIVFIISDGMANAGDMSKIQLKAVGLKGKIMKSVKVDRLTYFYC